VLRIELGAAGAQSASKIDPKDARLIKAVAVQLEIATRCQLALPLMTKMLLEGVDRKMLLHAIVDAATEGSQAIKKIGKEKFCALGRQLLESFKS
jgi:hypothetical protein